MPFFKRGEFSLFVDYIQFTYDDFRDVLKAGDARRRAAVQVRVDGDPGVRLVLVLKPKSGPLLYNARPFLAEPRA